AKTSQLAARQSRSQRLRGVRGSTLRRARHRARAARRPAMTYKVHPVRSYETEEGCTVVSQVQENAHGLVIERVALMCLRAGDGAAGDSSPDAAAVRCPPPARPVWQRDEGW